MTQTALVTGASGAIGPTLIRRLQERGYAVRALVRDARGAAALPAGVEVVHGDIRDCQLIRQAVARTDLVFHLAAKLHLNNPAPELKEE